MDKYTTHAVFRSYIALARAEHYAPSELGEAVEFVDKKTGRLIGSYPLAQVNFYSSEHIEEAIEKFWAKDFEEMFKAGVIAAPGFWANRLICSRLRKTFGDLNGICQFDRDGELNAPRRADFFVPERKEGLIERFLFYQIEKDGIKQIN